VLVRVRGEAQCHQRAPVLAATTKARYPPAKRRLRTLVQGHDGGLLATATHGLLR
jgi:hypothetical protein